MTFEIIAHADELAPLANDWNALSEPLRSPMVSYEWFQACADATTPPGRLFVAVLRNDGRVRAIAPLVLGDCGHVPTLEFLGHAYIRYAEPTNLLYADEHSLRDLLSEVLDLGFPLRLDRIPAESLAAKVLSEPGNGMFSVAPRESCSLFVPISGTWSEFEKSIPKKRRGNLRNAMKIAKGFGDVTFENHRPAVDTYRDLMRDLFTIEMSGWKGRAGTSIASSPYGRRFLLLYGEAMARLGMLRIFAMSIDGRPVAMRFAVEHARRTWEIKIGYDEAFRACSPGILLTHETIRDAFENGLEAHEFLGFEERWEHLWTKTTNRYLSFRIYPRSWNSALRISSDFAGFAHRKAKAELDRRLAGLNRMRGTGGNSKG